MQKQIYKTRDIYFRQFRLDLKKAYTKVNNIFLYTYSITTFIQKTNKNKTPKS